MTMSGPLYSDSLGEKKETNDEGMGSELPFMNKNRGKGLVISSLTRGQ